MPISKVDLIVGTGDEAVADSLITVYYTVIPIKALPTDPGTIAGALASNETIEVPVGGQALIPGWNEGVLGMKVGGKRQITIPPELAYGTAGYGVVRPNTTLIFEVDLLSVRPRPAER
ncbi:MAG TPA: FKBP-type peptidyl-prolyl cis-trans isomerase [Polyangiaceae bacterium]|nr:FKBP-type peptidyl-prolyl cis-trans isomerase [Polyangiaceae bacterium]